MKNYYYILGLSPNATLLEIKAAYRKLSKKLHPDVNSNDAFFTERFKDIHEAYETLSTESKRRSYDEKFANFSNPTHNQAGFHEAIAKERESLKRERENLIREREIFENGRTAYQRPSTPPKKTTGNSIKGIFIWPSAGFIAFLIIYIALQSKPYRSSVTQEPTSSTGSIGTAATYDTIPQVKVKVKAKAHKWLSGIWTGTIAQYRLAGNARYSLTDNDSIVLMQNAKSKDFSILYPAMGCSGHLVLIKSNAKSFTFREKMFSGKCQKDSKLVITRISRTRASYKIFSPTDSQLSSEGELTYSSMNQ